MMKFPRLAALNIAVLLLLPSLGLTQDGAAQEHLACHNLSTLEAREECEALYGYLETYIGAKNATGYEFYIEDMVGRSYPELRIADAIYIIQIFEIDRFLEQGRINRDSRRITTSILAWMGSEQTAGGAGIMKTAIARLHRIAPEATKRAITYTATLDLESLEISLYTPWSVAVGALDKYGANIRGRTFRQAAP